MKKTEVLNEFFVLVFAGKICFQASQALAITGRIKLGKMQTGHTQGHGTWWDVAMSAVEAVCLMSVQCHSSLYLNHHGNHKKFLKTGRKQTSLQSSRRARWRFQEITGQSALP